jgi:hypothetical protein
MAYYRVYLFNSENHLKLIQAETDEQALKAAQRFVDGCDVEVWYRERKIGRLHLQPSDGAEGSV